MLHCGSAISHNVSCPVCGHFAVPHTTLLKQRQDQQHLKGLAQTALSSCIEADCAGRAMPLPRLRTLLSAQISDISQNRYQ